MSYFMIFNHVPLLLEVQEIIFLRNICKKIKQNTESIAKKLGHPLWCSGWPTYQWVLFFNSVSGNDQYI